LKHIFAKETIFSQTAINIQLYSVESKMLIKIAGDYVKSLDLQVLKPNGLYF